MKKICNMNYEEATENFAKFSGKHCISDDYDMSADILSTINSHLSSEDAANYIYDIFCYGFMAGYKQSETDSKQSTKFHDETHKALTELAYNLPFGYKSWRILESSYLGKRCWFTCPGNSKYSSRKASRNWR